MSITQHAQQRDYLTLRTARTLRAYYDPLSESTRTFARPLAEKMSRLNELLAFKK